MNRFPLGPERLTLADGTTLAYHRQPGASPGVVFLGGFTSDMTGIKALTLEQEDLAKVVLKANPNTVLALVSSFPFASRFSTPSFGGCAATIISRL